MKLSFKINKPADFVFDYLTDMQKFASVHPVISKITDDGGGRFTVYETLKMGFVPFSFTYPVRIESNFADKIVLIRATVMKFTRIEMNFTVTPDNGFSVVEEDIDFKSPLPVKSVMQSIFRKQHTRLFENIESLAR